MGFSLGDVFGTTLNPIGGLLNGIDDLEGDPDQEAAAAERARSERVWSDLARERPTAEALTPEAVQMGRSRLAGAQADPRDTAAALAGVRAMQTGARDMIGGGLSNAMRADEASENRRMAGARGGFGQQLQMRGQMDPRTQALLQQQAASDRADAGGMRANQGSLAALRAMQAYGDEQGRLSGLSSDFRGQTVRERTRRAQGTDARSRFNTDQQNQQRRDRARAGRQVYENTEGITAGRVGMANDAAAAAARDRNQARQEKERDQAAKSGILSIIGL